MGNKLRFRQVHLDFHTSEAIEDIGSNFDKKQFQDCLEKGHIDSITVFSKCHHGWAYHPSKANEMHPNLDFDLLGAQIEAAHEIDVKTPVYLSAGLDEKIAKRHHDWLIKDKKGKTIWAESFDVAGYHELCFNTPYLDYLLEQIKETVTNYNCDGIFLDIVGVRECYCEHCLKEIADRGYDADNKTQMLKMWEQTYANYTSRVEKAIHSIKPGMPIFHNSGHIRCGRRDLSHMNSHLELESLPTGGWGYQHFPMSARYVHHLGMEYLGMTGKFHTSWGEFGGYKHPNALRYEAALNIANGAKCSVGDQLHPLGEMDSATYELIGKAYSEVEEKQEWCENVEPLAEIAMLNTEAVSDFDEQSKVSVSDSGCVKMLLEGHYLFDVVDTEVDLSGYKVVILPDNVKISDSLYKILRSYVDAGGKILASGHSGLYQSKDEFAFDFGINYKGVSKYSPTYMVPEFETDALKKASYVMYGNGYVSENVSAKPLGWLQNPYFNRTSEHFCSHRHAPSDLKNASIGIAVGSEGAYIAWDVFEQYDKIGSLMLKQMVIKTLDFLLEDEKMLSCNLPSEGVVTYNLQADKNRYICHLLYASPILRGTFDGKPLQVIEDIVPIQDTKVEISIEKDVSNVYLAPQMEKIDYEFNDGKLSFTIDEFECHQMVVIDYK